MYAYNETMECLLLFRKQKEALKSLFQEQAYLNLHIGHHFKNGYYLYRSQKAEALNNVWRGPSSFHQSLDISLSGEPRESGLR